MYANQSTKDINHRMALKVAKFLGIMSPHGSGKGTPKTVTPKSFYFIDQQKLQELLRASARFKDRIQMMDKDL